jgi:outer membrane protein assembly factor BamD
MIGPRTRSALALCLGLLLVWGCSGTWSFARGVTYRKTARDNYKQGMIELKDDNHAEAIKYFNFVKNKFPFSHFATLAELRIADTYYAQEKYVDAIDAYRQFQKFHPTHPEVVNGYAAYRVGQAYVEQIPSDWFLIPPSHEKDQSATRDALRTLSNFIKLYKKSKYLPEVKKLYTRCIRRIADHELYVARFYLDRDKPRAAILRLEALLKKFPDAGFQTEIMLLLGQTYLKLEQNDRAAATFKQMIDKHPDDPYSAKARLYLQHMDVQDEEDDEVW